MDCREFTATPRDDVYAWLCVYMFVRAANTQRSSSFSQRHTQNTHNTQSKQSVRSVRLVRLKRFSNFSVRARARVRGSYLPHIAGLSRPATETGLIGDITGKYDCRTVLQHQRQAKRVHIQSFPARKAPVRIWIYRRVPHNDDTPYIKSSSSSSSQIFRRVVSALDERKK